MHIVEQFLQSKMDDPSICEDAIFINDKFIAVIDGVTAKGKIKWNNHTSGYYAKENIMISLNMLNGTENATEVFSFINTQIYKNYENDFEFFKTNLEERLQATIAIYSRHHQQIWCFGDCQFMINDNVYTNEMKVDNLLSEVRSLYLNLEIAQGKSVEDLVKFDTSHEIIFPILKKQFLLSNTSCEYGYSVLDGFCEDFSSLIIHDVLDSSTVVIATDGYPVLKQTLTESESYLNELKEIDPLCIKEYKSTRGFTNGKKSIDDRAYIKFVI